MSRKSNQRGSREAGFSLLEVMVVIFVMSIILGAVFSQINTAQYRSTVEQEKADMFQEAREFIDQMSSDLRNVGYPNTRNYKSGVIVSTSDSRVAVGLVKIDVGELWFEGDVTGDGTVSTVHYYLDSTGTNCPCLKRSEQPKVNGTAPTQQSTQYTVEVQNVRNGLDSTGTFSTTQLQQNPIFRFYKKDGTEITPSSTPALPINIDSSDVSDVQALESINTIKASVMVQAPFPDRQTGLKPVVTVLTTMKLNNCAYTPGGQTSCP